MSESNSTENSVRAGSGATFSLDSDDTSYGISSIQTDYCSLEPRKPLKVLGHALNHKASNGSTRYLSARGTLKTQSLGKEGPSSKCDESIQNETSYISSSDVRCSGNESDCMSQTVWRVLPAASDKAKVSSDSSLVFGQSQKNFHIVMKEFEKLHRFLCFGLNYDQIENLPGNELQKVLRAVNFLGFILE